MCVALIGVLYAIILAVILLKSSVVVTGQQRGSLCTALGYTCVVVPLLVFEVTEAMWHLFCSPLQCYQFTYAIA